MTRYILAVAALVAIFCGYSLFHQPALAQVRAANGQQWEYKAILNQNSNGIETTSLNRLGAEGWELVAVWSAPEEDDSHFVLKRPK